MIENLLSRLDKVKPNGHKKWMACCPAHPDKSPSLAIKQTNEGTILLHCFAGCGASAILDSVNLSMTDLFPEKTIDDMKDWRKFLKRKEVERKQEINKPLDQDVLTLGLAQAMRDRGQKLSAKDLHEEYQAFLRSRHAHHNG